MALSAKAAQVLAALRSSTEGSSEEIKGVVFKSVYLDNARPAGMSARSFAGYLSALEEAGLYKSQGDDCFGMVATTGE